MDLWESMFAHCSCQPTLIHKVRLRNSGIMHFPSWEKSLSICDICVIDCFGSGTNKRREKYSETNMQNYFLRGRAYYLTVVPGSSHLALQPPWLFRTGPMVSSASGSRVRASSDELCCPGHLGSMLWGLSPHQETRLPLNQRNFLRVKTPQRHSQCF